MDDVRMDNCLLAHRCLYIPWTREALSYWEKQRSTPLAPHSHSGRTTNAKSVGSRTTPCRTRGRADLSPTPLPPCSLRRAETINLGQRPAALLSSLCWGLVLLSPFSIPERTATASRGESNCFCFFPRMTEWETGRITGLSFSAGCKKEPIFVFLSTGLQDRDAHFFLCKTA